MQKQKERKPKKQNVIMVKVGKLGVMDTYAAIDAAGATVLGGRKSFEAGIPVRGRSLNQNSLWAIWYGLIGNELGDTPKDVKKECKILYGVPILVAENESFRRMWNAKFANDTYVQQLFMMQYLPVTSLFSKGQGMIYQETLQREYAKRQIILEVL